MRRACFLLNIQKVGLSAVSWTMDVFPALQYGPKYCRLYLSTR